MISKSSVWKHRCLASELLITIGKYHLITIGKGHHLITIGKGHLIILGKYPCNNLPFCMNGYCGKLCCVCGLHTLICCFQRALEDSEMQQIELMIFKA